MKTNCFLLLLICFITLTFFGCSKSGGNTPNPPPNVKLPVPITDEVSSDSITATSAVVSGDFINTDGKSLTEMGFCWGTDSLPTISDNHLDVPLQLGDFRATITGLKENTTYHVRAYGKNSAGLAYGNSRAFTTITFKPMVKINGIFFLSSDFASIDCDIVSQGNSPIIASGICWSTQSNPTINDDTTKTAQASGEFVPDMTGLTVNTKYYVRAYAINNDGVGYSDTISVTPEFFIGEVFGGGKIFYIDNTNIHGLIAAQTDFSLNYYWLNYPNVEYTYAWDADDGQANTYQIISVQGNGTYAATACTNYNGGGYTDWFLPSINQLDDLYKVKDKIGNFGTDYYWSSTERNDNYNFAYVVQMGAYFNEVTDEFKGYQHSVRAVRAF